MQFDRVMSIGGNCEVSENLRRYTKEKRASLMDWWITPLGSIPKLLGESFEGLLQPQNLKMISGGITVMCKHYGIAHHHDFPRLPNKQIDRDAIPATLEALRPKYEMLKARFYADCDGSQRVLFIRSWRDTLDVPPHPRALDDVIQHDFEGTIAAFERAFPHLDFAVLFVNYGTHRCDHPRALFHNVHDKGDATNWSGSPGGWDEMFSRFVGVRGKVAA